MLIDYTHGASDDAFSKVSSALFSFTKRIKSNPPLYSCVTSNAMSQKVSQLIGIVHEWNQEIVFVSSRSITFDSLLYKHLTATLSSLQ